MRENSVEESRKNSISFFNNFVRNLEPKFELERFHFLRLYFLNLMKNVNK